MSMPDQFSMPPLPPEPEPKKPRNLKWLWVSAIAVVVGLLAVGSVIAVPKMLATPEAAAPVTVTVTAPPVTHTATATVTAKASPAATATVTASAPPAVTVTATATATASAATPAAAPTGVPQDGMNIVGTNVQPGTYSSGKAGCYWELRSDASDTPSGILSQDSNSSGSTTMVTIYANDIAFKSVGCAPWITVG